MIPEILLCFILGVFGILSYVLNSEKIRRKNNFPPGPWNWPLLGGTMQVLCAAGFSGEYWKRFHRVAQKYRKTFSVQIGDLKAVYTEDFSTVKEVLNSRDWTHRFPNHERFKEHTLGQNLGVMWSDSEPQKVIRKFIVRTLRTFGFGELKTAESFLVEEVTDLFHFIDFQRSKGQIQNEVYMHHFLKVPTLNILWRVMANYRFSYDDPKLTQLITAVEDISKINIGLDPEWSFPFLRHIPGCSPSRAKRPSFVICHEFFSELKDKRRERKEYREVRNDFIDYFLFQIDKERDNPDTIYTDDQFQVTCVDLLFGGLDTTVNSIEFGILYMTKFVGVQVKVQAEIDAVMGDDLDRFPDATDRMKFAEAVMWETFRWSNIVPIIARSNSTPAATIGGYNVEKDTICALNATAVHFCEEIWSDPWEFRPERFLNSENQIVNTEKVVAFGGGKRGCPGYAMARVTWLGFFAALLQRYNFRPSHKNPEISTDPIYGVANSPKPYHCIITLRKPNQSLAEN